MKIIVIALTVGVLMVFAILNFGELKFYLSGMKITENSIPSV